MKKFFKALALVLALVLVIGAIPASAATSFSLKKDTKVVYLGGAQGLKEDGTKCGTKSKYKISKLINGFDAATMYLKLESSDTTVVKTKDSKRKVYGKSIGEAIVTVYIYDKDNDALLDTLQPTIKVKKNATTIQFAVTGANGEAVDPTKKLGVNVPYTVTLSRRDAAGKLTDTDKRVITCDSKDVEIVAANKYNTVYTITFKKPGSYKLIASTVQSDIWNAPILSVPVDVVAGYDAVAVKQVALDAVAITYDTEIAGGLVAENYDVYYLEKDAKVYATAAQSLTFKGEVVTVKFLSDFEAGRTYYVEYGPKGERETLGAIVDGEFVPFSFVAAKVDRNSAASIEIPTQEITAGVQADLVYKILDKNGLDITNSPALDGILSFTFDTNDSNQFVNDAVRPIKVYIGDAGKSYTLKGVYKWVDDNGKEQQATGSGLVVSVAEKAFEREAVEGFLSFADGDYKTRVKADASLNKDAKALDKWAMGDDVDPGVILQIAVPYKKGDTTKYEGFANAGTIGGEFKYYAVKSANESIVMIGTPTADGYRLIANNEGSTYIVIYGIDANGNEKAIGVTSVTVYPKRAIDTFTVTATKTTINRAYAADFIEFTLDIKDQYGKAMGGTVEIARKNPNTNTPNYTGPATGAAGKLKVTSAAFDKEGSVTLEFKVTGTQKTALVNISVGDDATATSYKLVLDGGNTLDTCITNAADQEAKQVKLVLEGKTKAGLSIDAKPFVYTTNTFKTRSATSAAVIGAYEYYVNVTKDGSAVATGVNFDGTTFTNLVKGTTGTSPDAVRLAAGSYTIEAFKQTYDDAKKVVIVSSLGIQTLTVTDVQTQGTFKRLDNAEKLNLSAVDAVNQAEIASAYEIKFNDKVMTDVTFTYTSRGDKASLFVQKASFKVGNDTIGYRTIDVTIGEVVRDADGVI